MRIYLEDIVLKKRARVLERAYDVETLKNNCKNAPQGPSFYQMLKKDGLSIIGEIKKASPSKGLIKADFHPVELAKIYEMAVDGISVLTEEAYFLGHDDYLRDVSEAVSLPTLCKDFIVDPAQIYRAKLLGASCVLLIVAILTDDELLAFRDTAESIGLDALIEVHTQVELDRALIIKPKIIGINNRNLMTFETDLNTTLELVVSIPEDVAVISESGIFDEKEIKVLNKGRYDAILVGESFMRSDDMVRHAKVLRDAYKQE
jgi:indole-3-glycerol phosphate synthase